VTAPAHARHLLSVTWWAKNEVEASRLAEYAATEATRMGCPITIIIDPVTFYSTVWPVKTP
jgi:hypothetical protein